MRASIIIPVWNLWRYTESCLGSLARHTPREAAQIIVVDNGSTDATAEGLEPLGRELFGPQFKRIRLPENRGFAIACNAGAEKAKGDLLLFLNNDTVVSPGWLPPLLNTFRRPEIGAAGPLLLYPDNTVQHCGIFFDPLLRAGHLYEHFPADHPLLHKKRRLQAITGAALMIPRSIFGQINGFCEEYKNGYEDIDLCCQITRLGYRLEIRAESIIWHHTSKTPGRFEHESQNAAIASRRIAPFIRPDLHRFAYTDGYDLQFWPMGIFRPEVTQIRSMALDASSSDTHAALISALHSEPLWRKGWLKLVQMLSKSGNQEAALEAAFTAARFFPDPAIGQLCGTFASNNEYAPDGKGDQNPARLIEMLAPLPENRLEIIRTRLTRARKQAENEGDKLLASHIESWLGDAAISA